MQSKSLKLHHAHCATTFDNIYKKGCERSNRLAGEKGIREIKRWQNKCIKRNNNKNVNVEPFADMPQFHVELNSFGMPFSELGKIKS